MCVYLMVWLIFWPKLGVAATRAVGCFIFAKYMGISIGR